MRTRITTGGATALAAVGTLALGFLAIPGADAATPANARKVVPNTAPNWLAKATPAGTPAATAAVKARVYLAPKGGLSALKAAVDAVSSPSSSSYRKFITPAQYDASFAPTAASVQAVQAWLTGSGLTVTGVDADRRYVSVSGSVAAAQKAFGVQIKKFSHDGQSVQAPTGVATVPAGVAGNVLTVSGLDTTVHRSRPASAPADPPSPAFVNARPCSTYYGQLAGKYQADFKTPLPTFEGKTLPYTVCGYTGNQLRPAYEGDTTLTGAGVTVAVVDAYSSPTIAKDIVTYATNHGDAAYAAGQYVNAPAGPFTNQALCDASGWYGEQTLDIEAVHAMAPAAKIRYYGGTSCFDNDLLDTIAQVVKDNKASIVTNSYGDAGEGVPAEQVAASEQVFLQAAMQGISFMFSSGDSGDEVANIGVRQPDYQASDPYVTAVGGTSTGIGADNKISLDTGWGTIKYTLSSTGTSWNRLGFTSGAGGGYSTLNNRPTYQNGVVPATAPAGRAVPDVAMDADPNTGFLVGQTQLFPSGKIAYGEYRIGGTSLSSPLFAGVTALRSQSAGGRLGFLNPTIYRQARSGAFADIQGRPADVGNVRVDYANQVDASQGLIYSVRLFNKDSSLKVTYGWDDVTGVGRPTPTWLTSVSK